MSGTLEHPLRSVTAGVSRLLRVYFAVEIQTDGSVLAALECAGRLKDSEHRHILVRQNVLDLRNVLD